MRYSLKIEGPLHFPVESGYIAGSLFYKLLENGNREVARRLHEAARPKLVSVSRLIPAGPRSSIRSHRGVYHCEACILNVATPLNLGPVIGGSLGAELPLNGDGAKGRIAGFEAAAMPEFGDDEYWDLRTVLTRGKDKRYLQPVTAEQQRECAEALAANVRGRFRLLAEAEETSARAREWSGSDDPGAWCREQRIKVTVLPGAKTNGYTVKKGVVLPAWSGVIRLQAHPAFQRTVWSAGVGAKTALGAGFCEPLQRKR